MKLKEIIKIAAFDIDGTILPNGTTLFSSSTKEIFKRLKQNHITTVLATARDFATIGDFLEQLQYVDYFIGANGAFIWDVKNKQFIYKNTLKKEQVVQLYDNFANNISGFLITDFDKVYISPQTSTNSWFIKPFEANYKSYDEALLSKTDLYLVTINSNDPKKLSEEMQKYINQHQLEMEVSSRWTRGFYIAPIDVTKSSALNVLCSKLNFSLNNLIAFGDSSNDFEMIRDAYYGVAMECANEKIKQVAKDVALDCEFDGAYLKLKELNLI
ncbi:hypothetical protein BCF59_0730 [Mycoplasmopsis mustelae]|uniref:Haloacid dehalogenase n=1 Tax=Mycoplasmopsis mustelae TaxID=171289 RepID=A0A4R7UCL7_9BACT|nr:HAD family hydrolase [Mycoplasmopsis mustelae]TDV22694.1 hypothetical protein BCF59_0730 [Mycoplasmopsis mustelae]